MSQSRLEQYSYEIKLSNEEVTKEALIDLFFDIDFTDNADCFQDDTLELGYETEAERLATEFLANEEMNAYDKIEACLEAQLTSSGYYQAYDISATRIEDTYVIVVAIMIEC